MPRESVRGRQNELPVVRGYNTGLARGLWYDFLLLFHSKLIQLLCHDEPGQGKIMFETTSEPRDCNRIG